MSEKSGQPDDANDALGSREQSDALPDLASLLETHLVPRETALSGPTCQIGECVEAEHPSLHGRVRVRMRDSSGKEQTCWLPKLYGLPIRVGDRLLLVRPSDLDKWTDPWIATGVVDGLAERPRIEKDSVAQLGLERDEALKIVSRDGQPLVEISHNHNGPVVRLLGSHVRVEFSGKLEIAADQIDIEATRGQIAIKAKSDVVVTGEVIHLN